MTFSLKSLFFIGLTFLVVTPIQIFAQDATRDKEIAERFAKCDTNRDGKLTLAEAKGCMPRIYNNFSYIDAQNKGYLTVAEIEAMANR
jgi:Ca2+-binding EF-hand superfamily protein